MNIDIILKRNRNMLFEKKYYDKFKTCDVDDIYQFDVNNQFIANFFKNLHNRANEL